MSNAAFIESLSADPLERAIARRVLRILNDRTLDRGQRVALVGKAQHELLQHRAAVSRRAQPAKAPVKARPARDAIAERRQACR